MIDVYGLVVQSDGDGGDCPCRCGVVIGYRVLENHDPAIADEILGATQKYLRDADGRYFRYPNTKQWISDPKEFSRDQASRLMLGYGIAGRKDLVKEYYLKVLKNYLRHPNKDIIGPGEIIAIIRTLSAWYLYPLLLILDLKFLGDIINYKWQPWDIDNLFIMDLYYAQKKMWTPSAWLAAKLYDKDAAAKRVSHNLLDISINPCVEAGAANLWFLKRM
jgi:hypothetical protein